MYKITALRACGFKADGENCFLNDGKTMLVKELGEGLPSLNKIGHVIVTRLVDKSVSDSPKSKTEKRSNLLTVTKETEKETEGGF